MSKDEINNKDKVQFILVQLEFSLLKQVLKAEPNSNTNIQKWMQSGELERRL